MIATWLSQLGGKERATGVQVGVMGGGLVKFDIFATISGIKLVDTWWGVMEMVVR